ncbi:NAD(P)-binding protein [Ramaria rubella]|nr:NAD(P)-binding protein [Ramaria rubella]
MTSTSKKIIVVIGATGAQGSHAVQALIASSSDGTPSPYAIRAITRDTTSTRAKSLSRLGAEIVEGSFMDFCSIEKAFRGAYGAFVNTDGFTVGEQAEIFAGMRIFEIAKQQGIKHYVWGNLDYALKKGGYDQQYRCEHYDGKGRIAEWLKAQPSEESGLTWSVLTSGPYMDMLLFHMFGPLNKRSDGTLVFASPVGDGHVPMVSLKDLGFFARYIFDHPHETSAQDLEIVSECVGWDHLVSTFVKVTGQKAVFVRQTLPEWFDNFNGIDKPLARDFHEGFKKGFNAEKTTWRENFSGFWSMWRDDVIKRDMEWVKNINPETEDLETWMKRVGYAGSFQHVLKIVEDGQKDGSSFGINLEVTNKL